MGIEVKRDGKDNRSLFKVTAYETNRSIFYDETTDTIEAFIVAHTVSDAVVAMMAQGGPNRDIDIQSVVKIEADYIVVKSNEIKLHNPKPELVDEGDIEAEIAGTCPRRVNPEHTPDYVV